MNDTEVNDEEKSTTPERKREYIQRWLNDNLHDNINSSSNEFLNSLELSKQLSHEFELSLVNENPSTSNLFPSSPILGGKRLASFRNSKKIKVVKKKLITTNINKSECSNLILESKEDSNTQRDLKRSCEENSNLGNLSSATTKFSQFNEIIDTSITGHKNIVKKNLVKNIKIENCLKISKCEENVVSQLIESVSTENNSTKSTEVCVQEIKSDSDSDSDKTASDLIEDISTQMIVELSSKHKQITLSQNISNPSSESSEITNDIQISESITTGTNPNKEITEIFTPTDAIESVSTLESKADCSNKTSFILQYSTKNSKKKKNPKKGSLLETLVVAMGKERSSVNLLRHQLYRKSNNVIEKPFILLQIVQFIPVINDIQLFKCMLVEDTMDLLNDVKNRTHRFLTVMNVPEISNTINVTQKPILKVYEPWTVLDHKQLLLHITRFIAIPESNTENIDSISNCKCKTVLNVTHEFYCPCINEKSLSNKCKSKFHDNSQNAAQIIFNCK